MSDDGDQGVVHLGGCFCGNIRYQVLGVPVEMPTCHCSMCRKTSESAWLLSPGRFFQWIQERPSGQKRLQFNKVNDSVKVRCIQFALDFA